MMDTTVNRRKVLSATGVALLTGSSAVSPTGAQEHDDSAVPDDFEGADRTLEQELESFTAVLTDEAYEGDPETEPLGEAIFELREDEDEIWYDIGVKRVCNPREATLHREDGSEINQLCPAETEGSLQFEGLYSGLLCADVLTDDNLDGQSLAQLVDEMRNEEVYVTIRTEQRPEGALRGRTAVSEERGIPEEDIILEEDLEDEE